ncbi:MAG: alpha/beta hydrolase [Clostridia bacterium]|nr:alpha/beta hydrolase [Clostridia bacterium]
MIVKELDLKLDYEKAGLPTPTVTPKFIGFIPKNYDEYCEGRRRPAVLVLPGGGYHYTSEREATPIALEFLTCGAAAFVLRYSVSPDRFPISVCQVYAAIKQIRENADEWNIDPNNIAVIGFSAGGHLAASSGVLWNTEIIRKCGFTDDSHKPNGMILCYPVITGGEKAHRGSFEHLLGENADPEMVEYLSLENRVTSDTPRAFIWHTYEDDCVPVENSLLFASALVKNGISTELHIYPHFRHGLSLANDLLCTDYTPRMSKVASWIPLAKEWLMKD